MFRQLFLFILIGSAVARIFYRNDYHYFHEFDAFYKFHWNAQVNSWLEAFIRCNGEGATIFYPSVPCEFNVVTNLIWAGTSYNYTHIFVGIHDEFHIGEFITVDGSSTPFPILTEKLKPNFSKRCALLDIETGEYKIEECASEVELRNKNVGFICKKTVKPICPTVDEGYKYNKVTKKCYKLHKQLKPWNEAFKQCFIEGATLFFPENDEEFSEMVQYISINENSYAYNNNNPNGYSISKECKNYFLGIYQPVTGGEFFTVKGVPMTFGGADQHWDPDGGQQNGRSGRQCVSLGCSSSTDPSYHYKTESCLSTKQFICEMNTLLQRPAKEALMDDRTYMSESIDA